MAGVVTSPRDAFYGDDMQMVRAKIRKVVEAAIDTEGDPMAILATMRDRSPLVPGVGSPLEDMAAWAGCLAVLCSDLVEQLSSEHETTPGEVLLVMLMLDEPTLPGEES